MLTRDCYLLVFVFMEVPVNAPRRSCAPVYSADLPAGRTRGLTPVWPPRPLQHRRLVLRGLDHCSVQDLRTNVYSFCTCNCSRRTLLVRGGGWPSPDDNTVVDKPCPPY
ncbi:hypothetical protein ZWY2020_052231 [Hordeum vulgare]|nr:hypothetical protein ZWY2020_052231 [Hordeum vulgare]